MFPEKFLFYMGTIVTTELPGLAPRQRIDDCVEIHILQSELLWSAVIISPKNSALGTTLYARSPCHFGSQADSQA